MNAPEADAPQELQFRLQVDEAHCDRAAQGMRLMAQYQYRGLVRRYEGTGWLKRFQQPDARARVRSRCLSSPRACSGSGRAAWNPPHRGVWFGLAAILFLEALAFWLLPLRADRIGVRIRVWFERSSAIGAARMRKTRREAPFEAVYDLRGDLLAYSRVEKGQWTPRWHRQLGKFRPRGVALQAPGVIAIFRKPGVVVPAIIVLTAEDGAMAAAIRALGWTIVDIDPTSGEPVAPATGVVNRS